MALADTNDVLIIGAGQAGIQVARALRKRGYDGAITLLGNEGYRPYQRPPLSKAFLKGEMDETRLAFKPAAFFDEQNIGCQLSNTATAIDAAGKRVSCADGPAIGFDRLVIATGATPIDLPIPGASLPGVFALRGLDDAKELRTALRDANRLVVIGGGYIGLEVASAARQMGLDVTVVERLPRLLSRVTSPPVSDFFLHLHRDRGVDVRLNESVAGIDGRQSVASVRLASGETVPADVVLVGVGVRPNDELAAAAGVACDDGILVDAHCRTSDAHIYAAGDCARSVLADTSTIRLESVHNALVQGDQVAAAIVGAEPPAFDPPWFWSDQYEIKLQTVGLFSDHDDVLVRGDVAANKFAALYFRHAQLVAIDAVNDPVSFMSGKRLLRQGLELHRDDISDPDVSLKEVVAAKTG